MEGVAICDYCHNIQEWKKFNAPKDYLACIEYIQQLVTNGGFELLEEESTCPLNQVETEDGWADEIMVHMVRCKHCGQVFTCVVNTYRGSGSFKKGKGWQVRLLIKMVRDILSRSPAWDEGRGLSYPPCLLMKPVLRLRLHATQSQPCFPAVSNALALPGGNRIFAATPTERITHYTLQAKSCAKGKAPLETPDNKTGWISRTSPVLDIQPLFVVSSPRFVVCV